MAERPFRVLLVAYATFSRDARLQSYVRTLRQQGIDFQLWTLREPGVAQPAGVIGYSTKYQGRSLLRYVLSYLRFFFLTLGRSLLQPRAFRVIHCHNMPNFLVLAFLPAKWFGARIILDNHDVMPVVFAAKATGTAAGVLTRLLRLEERLSVACADRLITADHGQLDYFVAAGHDPRKISVILNLPNPSFFRPLERSDRLRRGLKLVYHGTIAHRLGLDLALRAVALVRDEIEGLTLDIIGEGDHLEEVIALSEELHLERTVRFSRRFYPVEELQELLSEMDAGLIPSRRTEATDRYMLPVKLLEYVYLGLPVIAPDLRVIRHYFPEDALVYYRAEDVDEMAAAIRRLSRSTDSKERVVKAHGFFEEHNWERQQEGYAELLRSPGDA